MPVPPAETLARARRTIRCCSAPPGASASTHRRSRSSPISSQQAGVLCRFADRRQPLPRRSCRYQDIERRMHMIWRQRKWILAATLACIGAATAALAARGGAARVAGVPVHFTSHQLCSAAFVAGLDPTEYYNEAIKPKLGPIRAFIRYEVDRERQEVRTDLAG